MSGLWKNWLIVWSMGVVVFGLVLCGAAWPATDGVARAIFALVGAHPSVWPPEMRFATGLMGAVSVGWSVTVLALTLKAETLSRDVWRAVIFGFAVWYVVDSAISITTGFPLNAVSNTLLIALGLPPVFGAKLLRG